MTITEFEQRVLEQKPVASDHYDKEYWTGDWRAHGNNYHLETRRKIEDRNPHLIKEVFQPRKALDLGCGPGALMHLLWEIGVDVEGIDYADSSLRQATPEMRDRITIGEVGDPTLKSEGAYDLVICREVLEHITLLNKDMLRLMFVLEGCRSRPDLEARMDWGGKGRVLVLEKV